VDNRLHGSSLYDVRAHSKKPEETETNGSRSNGERWRNRHHSKAYTRLAKAENGEPSEWSFAMRAVLRDGEAGFGRPTPEIAPVEHPWRLTVRTGAKPPIAHGLRRFVLRAPGTLLAIGWAGRRVEPSRRREESTAGLTFAHADFRRSRVRLLFAWLGFLV
jgi:hypothetical protein